MATSRITTTLVLSLALLHGAGRAQDKRLPLPGKVFAVDGKTAFIISPSTARGEQVSRPWVWYAPTLRRLPAKAERWMFERFLRAGVSIAGIDVGESYGSPEGRAGYDALYAEMRRRGFGPTPVLLARSRGGLMLYSWAVENANRVGGIAGIYPVCDIASYPGLERAAPAYGLSKDALEKRLSEFNPVDRLAPLAKADVPIFHIHGDRDRVVPLDANSARVRDRYRALGGRVGVEIQKGRGHDMWQGWFESSRLTDFVIARAKGQAALTRPPNVVLIYVDDLGYGDLGCFGSKKNRTPHLDRIAAEGMRFTDFYVTSGVCTPSRASLMTGCYPQRVNLHVDESGKWVLFPISPKGLHPEEVTIAEVLKARGYATACIGKWHLGDQKPFLPTRQGFDRYFGIPYSNDMNRKKAPLPLLRDEEVIEAPVKQRPLTRRYTDEAIRFIEENANRPFLLYLPHTAVHLPLFPGKEFAGKSANGKYGDWVEEVDASTGEIASTLERLGIDDNTLIIFASDNGSNGRNGGSNAPLKGRKGNTDEGSMRVPCIMRWPARIPAGRTCSELAATIDLMPSVAALAGTSPPSDRTIDGRDIRPLMFGSPGAKSPHEAFFYYHTTQLQAVRRGKWKLVLPQDAKKRGWSGIVKDTPLELFDLEADVAESRNVADAHPEVVSRLLAEAERARAELGDGARVGSGRRPAGRVERPAPLVKTPR